jgi:Protein of unknown function (DUF3037)
VIVMTEPQPWIAYDFAVIRVVPHPHLGDCIPIGVVMHAPTAEFLGLRVISERAALARRIADVDLDVLVRYVNNIAAIVDGDADGGPIALVSRSERFHWLTAPRSDVIESGPVHSGLCRAPEATLADLFRSYILAGYASPAAPEPEP